MLKTITRQLFARLNRHLPYRLVHRDPLPGAQTAVNATIPPSLSERCLKVAAMEQETLWRVFDTHPEGLNAAEVTRAREKHGENRLPAQKPSPWWVHLWVCYRNPFNILLTILGGISYATEDLFAAGVIALMVGISTLLNFVQEARSTKAADALKAMVSNTATVLRVINENGENAWLELPIDQLVPGDIIKLAAGDMIPADLRIIQARDLFVAQASLTGESLPVEKVAATREPRQNNPLECDTLCFMGTNVVSGTAQAVVMATGAGTWFGQLAGRVSEQDNEQNAFQKGISRVSMLLIRFMLVMAPVVLIINGYTKGDWWEAALFALSVAVGLTPEMLPMIVTSTLARGAVKLSKQKVIVKHLDAIQNFGAMDILCTDKTGTLTQDKIVLENHTDISGKPSEHVLHCAWLNSHYQTGLKNLLDTAVLEGVDETAARQLSGRWQKIDEIPFDFERRRMSVVAEDSSVHQLVCKGALQEILNVCTQVRHNGDIVPLDDNMLRRVKRVTDTLNRQGLRVVAVATKYLPAREGDYQRIDESDLILEGYIAFLDPPKETTAPALKALKASGITVKILTGDSELVAAKVCHEVGLDAGDVIIGSDIEGLSDDALAALAARTTLFARLTPMHKERIVTLLKREGHVVGFMGDGINDAPALRAADIGISVDGAVDIAREAADIILLEKSLMVLEEGVIEGRRTFSNMLKYIKMTASSNFGNVFSVLVASAFLPFLPMLPLHLLIQNLLYDVSQVAIPFDNVDEEQIQKPQRWNPADLGRFMVFFGPISSIFDILTFCLMWWVFHANTPETQTLFQSGWFVVGLLSQTLIVHMIRTRRLPFIQSRAAWPLMAMTLLVMVVGVSLPFSPLASYLQLQALPLSYFPWLIAILAGYMTLTQLVKGFYSRRYGWQ
ncbi:magnesium-translocating P-type ATPase [Salmonella enterica]|uniref:Magnesium-transporting ATPase, P-type 1 n=1 Tax=Salmonella enterica TaxID=28901 RepID=A0A5U4EZN4_SALER|nr:magnesium-translocating P-type ATPase [Salmonella enterica]EAY7337164.1 magnesium-translocating P-type ATPase [Salmonella enterica]EAY7366534.1 magnesium-translocating P-type ATPase [Salmonella enterica]EBP1257577.1 magnesium-translocating P-type ATPase [Salmonella enterica]EBP8722568.1 magnesium-translocating P-type ATPase [Salmonella enterica]